MGQYVAHRQVLQTANRLEAYLPLQKVRPLHGRREVPTRVLDEDTYPVGGFTSISNRGTIESLLHSQLAYMEPPGTQDGPDLFDVKFLRDELYYYSRDENQVLRRRRSFIFAFWPELTQSRFKDPELPVQRVVMLMGLVLTATMKLINWLSEDSLRFEFLFVGDAKKPELGHEIELFTMLLGEQIANGTVTIERVKNAHEVKSRCEDRARRALCNCLAVGVTAPELEPEHTVTSRLVIDSAAPKIGTDDEKPAALEGDDPADVWGETLHHLLQLWV
jgi:hypothetical protein